MGLFITLTELLGRLAVLTPLVERYVGANRTVGAHSLDELQQSIAELGTVQAEGSATLESSLKDQQIRLARLEDSSARISNRLADISNDWEKLEADVRKLSGQLRIVLAVGLALLVAILAAIALLIFRVR
jgi:septal ring factor EnvC (AmiA/AmiB activator)